MSLERACVNCKRCYNLANHQIIVHKEPDESDYSILRDNDIWNARNEAMKALESAIDRYLRSNTRGEKWRDQFHIAIDALENCKTCVYADPEIAKLVEEKGL